jgi:hypothetical protein
VENANAHGTLRTVANYCNAVQCDNGSVQESVGVKFDSHFNQLKYFHVCNPGLPPCLGHDLFEGVVTYDMALIVRDLVKVQKWFTYVELNARIEQFQFVGADADSKPVAISSSPDSKKLSGQAAQNWCLLRLFPVIIGDRVTDVDNPVWHLLLTLRRVVELVCAPCISDNQIAEMKDVIEEYIYYRQALFPEHTLKPKHHYLTHYPWLVQQFGPLIRLWTMRFESKHSYFKECARKLHNFKNLCSTVAQRHQLLQSYLRRGSVFSADVKADKAIDFDLQLLNPAVQTCVSVPDLKLTPATAVIAQEVIYKGTKYNKGMLLVTGGAENELKFGRVLMIIVKDMCIVYFVLDRCESKYIENLGVYQLKEVEDDSSAVPLPLKCVCADHLLDYHPVYPYRLSGSGTVVALHHSVCIEAKVSKNKKMIPS